MADAGSRDKRADEHGAALFAEAQRAGPTSNTELATDIELGDVKHADDLESGPMIGTDVHVGSPWLGLTYGLDQRGARAR